MDLERCAEILSGLDLFGGFDRDELMQLFRASRYRIGQYKKGEVIHLQNEVCGTMDIILEGRVAVQKIDMDGSVLKITSFSDGSTVGANLIFSHRNTYPMTVTAEKKTAVFHMPRELILALSQRNVSFLTGMLTEISDRTLVLTDKIDAISLKSIRRIIIDYLRYESRCQNSSVIRLDASKKDLAERFGIQRTSLSRELNKMRREGMISYDSRTVTILRPGILSGDEG